MPKWGSTNSFKIFFLIKESFFYQSKFRKMFLKEFRKLFFIEIQNIESYFCKLKL